MYTGTAEDFSLTIDRKTFFRVPFKKSDSKRFLYDIFSKCCQQSIQIRMITVPEFCIRDLHTENRRVSCIFYFPCKNILIFVQNINFHHSRTGSLDFYFNHCRCITYCMNLDSIDRNVLLVTCPEVYRTVDACSGIPAAVWLIRISCDHTDLILCFIFQKPFCIYIKICIAIRSVRCFRSININFRIVINTLEFNENFFAAVL